MSTYLEHDRRTNRKFLEHFEKKFDIRNESFIKIFQHSSPTSASFLGTSWTSLLLEYNPIGVPYNCGFYWRIERVQLDLFNTLNMVERSFEHFLETLEKNLYLHKNHKSCHPSQL